ncbi:MAG: DUF2628 domain-containing protein [Rhizobiales bacterium]|nr:DUF2628 domain-containing protein [Hyphomicrobiales bacterium]
MSIYTVHQPPLRTGEASADPHRFAFVRDGFYFWALLLGPVWMLFHRLWIVTVLYVIAVMAVETCLWILRVDAFTQTAVGFVLAVLIGLEAATLRRWTLDRRGWKNVGIVVGDDIESAERRYFATLTTRQTRSTAAATSVIRMPANATPEVIGLFPEPGGPR